MAALKVFISYSWDSDEHKAWVKHLADRLFAEGVDVVLDQYEAQSGDNVTYFMERAVTDTDKVLLILTESYKTKADGRGGGVGYEYSMINAEWYNQQTNNNKFIPILRGKDANKCKPVFLNSVIHIDMSNDALFEEKFKELYFRVYDEPMLLKPEVGQRPDFDKLRPASPQVPVVQPLQQQPPASNIKPNTMSTDHIRKLIGANKIDQAIEEIKKLAKSTGDTELLNDVTTVSQNHQENERKNRVNTLSYDEYSRGRSKVADGLLRLLGQVGKTESDVMDKEEILKLIDVELGSALEALYKILGKRSGTFNDLYNEYVDPPNNFSLTRFRSRLKAFVRINI